MTANGTAPQIDASGLAAARKRTLAAAKRARTALADELGAHEGELKNGDVPPAAGLRKTAEKYTRLLELLDMQDTLLTPEALEAVHSGYEESQNGQVTVSREDLALLTGVITSMHPGPADGTPLGRLVRAAHGGLAPSEMADLAAEPDPGFPPQGS
jgi:hypothetical protein